MKAKCMKGSQQLLSKYKVDKDVDKETIVWKCSDDYRKCLNHEMYTFYEQTRNITFKRFEEHTVSHN